MPFDVTCPHCGYSVLAVSEQRQDKVEECPSCGKLVKLSAPRKSRLLSCLVILMVVGAGLFLLSIPGILAFREAGRRMTCSWHLKQIGLALHNYHDSYGSFPPPYTVDAAGNRLHSWRALLLPFVESQDIYDQIDFSKPWNAPENEAAFRTPIKAYCCPSSKHGQVDSCASQYVVVVGLGTMFEPNRCFKLDDIQDGREFTLLVVESADRSSHWMDPTDLDFKSLAAVNQDGAGISSQHPGGAQVLMADGGVYFVDDSLSVEAIRAAATRAGGERNQIGEVEPPSEEELLAAETLDQALKRGKLVRVAELTPPPVPSPLVDGVDLRKLSARELKERADASEGYVVDYSKTIPAQYHYVQATNRGRLELADKYFDSEQYDFVAYWVQEAVIEEGVNPQERGDIRPGSQPFWSPEGKKVAALFVASEKFWQQVDHNKSELTLPKDYDGKEPIAVLACLHPAIRSPKFFPIKMREKLANDFRVAVLAVGGTHCCGPESYYWKEDYTEHYATDLATIDAAIKQHVNAFSERTGERIALGVAGGAFVAFGAAYWEPDKYAGAIVLDPHDQMSNGVKYGQVKPAPAHARQSYFILTSERKGWHELFAKLQVEVATEAKAYVLADTVKGVICDSGDYDFGTITELPDNESIKLALELALGSLTKKDGDR